MVGAENLVPGDYFGVGEGKEKGINVISDHKVECLLVNKMVLLKHEVPLVAPESQIVEVLLQE